MLLQRTFRQISSLHFLLRPEQANRAGVPWSLSATDAAAQAVWHSLACPRSHSWWVVERPLVLPLLFLGHNLLLPKLWSVSFLVLLLILPTPVILFSSLRVSWKSALWCTERLNRGVDEGDFSACFPGTSPNPPQKSRISPGSSYFRILFHTIPVGDSEEVNTLSLTTWPNLLMKYVPKYLSDGSFLLYSQ